MPNPQLAEYVKTQLAKGIHPDMIKKAILAAGWSTEDVDAVFLQLNLSSINTSPIQSISSHLSIVVTTKAKVFFIITALIGMVFFTGIFILLVFGIHPGGGLAKERDDFRTSNILYIQNALNREFVIKGAYPASLDELIPIQMRKIPTDPQTYKPYEYQVRSSGQDYKLCVTFESTGRICERASGTTIQIPCENSSNPLNFNWQDYISKGNKFAVNFDCSHNYFDDTQYSGDWMSDPMGSIKGGEIYVVQYAENDGWYATGFVQDRDAVETIKYPLENASVSNNKFSIWGRVYTYNQQGEVIDQKYGLIGHLIIPSPELLTKNNKAKLLPHWTRVDKDEFEGKTCADFCGERNKQCNINQCPEGPRPCSCNGGLCEIERWELPSGPITCEFTDDGNCNSVIFNAPSLYNFYCCCG